MITVVGLGMSVGDETKKARAAIKSAEVLAVRTFKIPVLSRLKKYGAVSMDFLFEKANDFCELDQTIADELLSLSSGGKNVVYCVDGDGFSDSSVVALIKKCEVNIIQGVSDFGARKIGQGVMSLDAYTLLSKSPVLDSSISLCITGLDNALLAGDVKLKLLDFYPPEHSVYFRTKGGEEAAELADIDRQKRYGSATSVFVPALEGFNKNRYCFADLVRIITRLTASDGCEWDKAQTHSSIRINMIEEAYEAVDAIDAGDVDAMIEETGDVMLQSVLHADIARRFGEYNISDVVDGICKKLVTRHTHIFGSDKAKTANEALGFWEAAKAQEKHQETLADKLDSIPSVFPATLKAAKALSKARKGGFELGVGQIKTALADAIENEKTDELLLYCVALSQIKNRDAEAELNALCAKVIERLKAENSDNKNIVQIVSEITK